MNTPSHDELRQVVPFSAVDIAKLIAVDPQHPILPTPEQAEIIEQPIGSSVLVIAGAGSGKTETMANRVVWLVANGFAEPDQVLGLTFTRKAAGELQERISTRLQTFARRLHEADAAQQLLPVQRDRATQLRAQLSDGLTLPEVNTYNAFASSIVQEFGAFAGFSTSAAVIDHAMAWGIARKVVTQSNNPKLAELDLSIATIVQRVMQCENAVNDHLTTFEAVLEVVRETRKIEQLPYNHKTSEGQYAGIRTVLANLEASETIVELAQAFAEAKKSLGVIEFSDQLALAVRVIEHSDDTRQALQQRTPFVLLDEVQDTSVAQTRLLSKIFGHYTVMAVGDPHQSIYGFRGASASNLRTFHQDFSAADSVPEKHGSTLSLSTSWRNPTQVLAAANTISRPLTEKLLQQAPELSVQPLTSRQQYFNTDEPDDTSSLTVSMFETIDQEFTEIATWLRDQRNAFLVEQHKQPTAAVLFRGRKHMAALSAELWRNGVPNRIVGLGGLLTTPEVSDIVSALRCIWFADANSELIRLLAGPRFRVAPRDLKGLRDAARWFAKRDHTQRPFEPAETPEHVLRALDAQVTLLDALDEIASMSSRDHAALHSVSETGRERLFDAAVMFRDLRKLAGGDLTALIRRVTQQLRIDIELDAAEHTGFEGSAAARANIESFIELVESFLAVDDLGTLSSLLDWLERATEDDEPAEHVPEPDPSYVQLITIHGAKGLEWNLVVVPRCVEGEFPSLPRDGLGWLRPGQLPDVLRGDASARAVLRIENAATQKELLDQIEAYKQALVAQAADEERRLAYVAVTRAQTQLLLTGSFWAGQKLPKQPAMFLKELAQEHLAHQIAEHSEFTESPSELGGRTLLWPPDPLGERRTNVMRAARAVQQAMSSPQQVDEPILGLLLAEAAEPSGAQTQQIHPERITASTFHELVDNPKLAARNLLRPIPTQPFGQTVLGNQFHEWIERRLSNELGTALVLNIFGEDAASPDNDHRDQKLNVLISQFEQSRWGDLRPIAVELELSVPFGDTLLVCKLDAVYEHVGEAGSRIEIVDWKTGKPPKTKREQESRLLQLDLYRHAYSVYSGRDLSEIDVTLFYVSEGVELSGSSARSFEELVDMFEAVVKL